MNDKSITVTINVEGADRAVAADLVLSHLARALVGRSITGESVVVLEGDGRVTIDGLTVYKPLRPSDRHKERRVPQQEGLL